MTKWFVDISAYSKRLFGDNMDDELLTDFILEILPLHRRMQDCGQLYLFMELLLYTAFCLYRQNEKRAYGYSRLNMLLTANLSRFPPCQLLDIHMVLDELQRRDPAGFRDDGLFQTAVKISFLCGPQGAAPDLQASVSPALQS